MSFKEIIEKLKKETKFITGFRILFYLIGIILVFVGGIELMTMFFVAFFAFLIGKYYEKTMSAIRDYRLTQKINSMTYTQAEYDSMKKELETLRVAIKNRPVIRQKPKMMHVFDEDLFYENEI